MKVFTVGMDQKPPLETTPGTPPPSYAEPHPKGPAGALPLPMGPEVPHPIILRKSRGYKGILLVMLAVFLMAIFALTLSEMAYNRQRDENFFRLQLAQLRHRLGFQNQFERNHQFGERIVPVEVHGPEALSQNSFPSTTTEAAKNKFLVDNEPNSESNEEVREKMANDARLQFLRRILQKIKQNAEDMGLEGTMQVSVVEVEPQHVPEFFNNLMGRGKDRHEGEDRRINEERPRFNNPSEDPRSDAFLDSFGEFHAPNPFTGQQPERREHGQPRGRVFGPWQEQQIEIAPPMLFGEDFRPPQPSDWDLQRPQIEAFEIRPEGKSQELNNQEIMGEMYGRKFGRMLQDLIAARLQNHFLQQQQMSMLPQRPSFPIEPVQQPQQQQGWWGMEQPQIPQQPQVEPWVIQDTFPRFPQQQQIPQVQQQLPQQPQVQPAQAQQQAQQAQQNLNVEPQPPQPQPERESGEAQAPAIRPPKANVELVQDQQPQVFGGFPQPAQQFPIFIENERQQPQDMNVWPQQPQQQGQQHQAAIDFMPPQQQPQGPAGWTHQTEVDFPAVKFPQSDSVQNQFEHAHSDAEPHIFFQVDEPQPGAGTV